MGKSKDPHSHSCTVCKHPKRRQIENDYLAFASVDAIERNYDLPRDSFRRHCKYYSLQNRRDVEAGFWKVVEIGLEEMAKDKGKKPTPTNVNVAFESIGKLRGLYVDRIQHLPQDMQDKSDVECLFFARNLRWPTDEEKADLERLGIQ